MCSSSVESSVDTTISFKGYLFPLSLRMVEEMLAARGIELAYEALWKWSTQSGPAIAKRDPYHPLGHGDKSHLDRWPGCESVHGLSRPAECRQKHQAFAQAMAVWEMASCDRWAA